jgi:hypothetical protein
MAAPLVNPLQRLVAIGFLAGALSILVFHQGTIALLQLVEGRPLAIYRTNPIAPFGVPQILNSCFWGGVWGIVFLWAARRFAGRRPAWLVGLVVGAVATTAVAWFVVAPIKGLPMASGWNPATMWRGPVINGMFGLGSALFAGWLEKRI